MSNLKVPTIPGFDYGVFRGDMAYQGQPLVRGERNNNPGNLVNTPETWQGEIVNGDDKKFMQFTTAVLGIRALGKLLLNYQRKYGLDTIREIISRWAPPNENDTEKYIEDAADECMVDPDTPISVRQYLPQLITTIIRKECGRVAYKPEILQAGATLATVAAGMGGLEPDVDKPNPLEEYKVFVTMDGQDDGTMKVGLLLAHKETTGHRILPQHQVTIIPKIELVQ